MELKQLSVFVENKKGRLAEITSVLGESGVDIRALSIADTTDYGILRLIVDKPEVAMEALKKNEITVSLTTVIAIAISDKPGMLAKAVRFLSDNDINIEYMYAFLNPSTSNACVILRVEDVDRAVEVFQKNGIPLMDSGNVYQL